MARFDVFPNPGGTGYLLDVQADLLDGLNSRIVVPLFRSADVRVPMARLNPNFVVDGKEVVMMTQFLATVSIQLLTEPVANLNHNSDEITNALDFAFQGF